MSDNQFLGSIGFAILIGITMGSLFNFLEGEHLKNTLKNSCLGLLGGFLGWIAAAFLPILPDYHFDVTMALTLMFSVYFMMVHWMLSKNTTPIAKHLSNYSSAPQITGSENIIPIDTPGAA